MNIRKEIWIESIIIKCQNYSLKNLNVIILLKLEYFSLLSA